MTSLLYLTFEIVVFAAIVIGLHRLRDRYGLAPLCVFVGAVQYLQAIWVVSVQAVIFGGIAVAPGSAVVFTGTLVALLLVYVLDGAAQARRLIVGVVLANLALIVLNVLVAQQGAGAGMARPVVPAEHLAPEVRSWVVGNLVLLADALIVVILYEILRGRAGWLPPVLRTVGALLITLTFDSVAWVTLSFAGREGLGDLLVGNLAGKAYAGTLYGVALWGYVAALTRAAPGSAAPEPYDPFRILTYRERYRQAEERFRRLFEVNPVSIFEEDFTGVMALLEQVPRSDAAEADAYLRQRPELVEEAARRVRVTAVNRASLELYGADSAEQLVSALPTLLGPQAMDMFREELVVLAAGRTEFRTETLTRSLSGAPRHVLIHLHVGGEPPDYSRVIVSVLDVTEQRQAEAARARLAGIVEQSANEIYTFDATTLRFLYLNGSALRNIGYSEEQARTLTPVDLKPEFTEASFRDLVRPMLEGRQSQHVFETIHRRADGSEYPVRVHLQLYDVAGERQFVAVIVDITEHRRAQAERERLVAILEATPDFVGIADEQGHISYLNPAARRQLGLRPDADVRGMAITDFLEARDWHAFLAGPLVEAKRSGSWVGETVVRLHGGRRIPMSQAILYSPPAAGEPGRIAAVARDLSDRARVEEQLRHAASMEAVGRLAGGLAHDFNNILTVITSTVDLMLDQRPPGEDQRDLETVRGAALSAASLTRQLLAFSRQLVLRPVVANVNEVVSRVAAMLRSVIREDIALDFVLDAQHATVFVDVGQLEQALINMALNARDAMPEGGRLTVRTRHASLAEPLPLELGAVPAGRWVLIEVRDTGTGMSEEVRARAFDPFFTTKAPGRGTGLGLASLYGFVKQSGGHVGLESAPGLGASFTVYLPCVDERSADAAAEVATARRGSETILLVEDNRLVRAATRRVLARFGYTVLEADGAEPAREVLRAHAGPVHLLLTDVVMPGTSGPQLADALRRERRDLRVLLMSGYAGDAVASRSGAVAYPFIGKPFTYVDLAERIRATLDAPPPGPTRAAE